jgi:hypothetical protein
MVCSGSEKLFDVFTEEVGFKIHGIADLAFAKRGDFISVRDDPDAETVFLHGSDGEADAIERDRTFVDHVAHDFGRCGDIEDVIALDAFPPGDLADAIDVAGDKMAAEFAARTEGAFEIYASTNFSELEIGEAPRFLEEIELDEAIFAAGSEFHDGEATAVDGNAGAEFEAATDDACAHGQSDRFRGRLDGFDCACFFNDTGEHKSMLQITG